MLFNSSKITGCKSLYRCNQNLSVLAGAGRLELCSSLLEGGLTPSLGEHLQIPLAKKKRKEKLSHQAPADLSGFSQLELAKLHYCHLLENP